MSRLVNAILSQINRTGVLNARPFDPATRVAPPHGRWGIVHYGVMVPGLPAPFRFFDAIVVLGTARAPVFANPSLVRTTDSDSAWALTGSGVTTDSFRPYSIAEECTLTDDGTLLRFGDELRIERGTKKITVRAIQPRATVELTLRPTAAVSHFAHLPGIYDHWSLLCLYEGTFGTAGGTFTRTGLCTYEYARAVNLPLPFLFFTYQILDVDDRTQVLMGEVLGPAGLPVQRTVYVRGVDGTATTHTQDFRHQVLEYARQPRTTPDGHRMQMPKRFNWAVDDDSGEQLISVDGITNDDFVYGLGSGYAGSYQFTGRFRGAPITGTGYIEWIDRRRAKEA
jgi:hypothetical protein